MDDSGSIADPARILVRGVNWLGDAVMTTPALRRLRERFPSARITVLTPEKLAEVYQRHPAVDAVVSIAKHEGLPHLSLRLRAEQFDLAVVLPNSPRSALEPWLAGIPRRVGFARPWRNWFLTQAVPTWAGHVPMRKKSPAEIRRLASGKSGESGPQTTLGTEAHQIHEYLGLVAALGANSEPIAPELFVDSSETQSALAKFFPDLLPGPASLFIGVNPGAEYGPAKRWPIENFAAVVRAVSRQVEGCVWVAFGGAGDVKAGETLARLAGGRVNNLAGRTSIRELMALLKSCRAVLTNDTGPMHVAAAVGTRVVVPFGSTSPELTGPGLPGDPRHHFLRGGAPCAPCFQRVCPIDFRCMTGITVDRVATALMRALEIPTS